MDRLLKQLLSFLRWIHSGSSDRLMDRLLKQCSSGFCRVRNRFEWPFDGSTTETTWEYKTVCLRCSSDRLMDRLLKLLNILQKLFLMSSSDRLMDRLLKLCNTIAVRIYMRSSDRLMDRLLKLLIMEDGANSNMFEWPFDGSTTETWQL